MNCYTCREMIPLAALGELNDDRRRGLEDHLKDCDSCRKELEQLAEIGAMLADQPDDGLSELERLRIENNVLRQLAVKQATGASSTIQTYIRVLARVAAALVLFLIGYLARPAVADWFNGEPPVAQSRQYPVLEQIDRSVGSGHRFTGEGLKLILHGRSALGETIRQNR